MTKPHINRRRAIATLGAAGLGGVLAACGDDSSSSEESADDRGPTGAPTNRDLVARLDEANACTVTPEQTAGPYYLNIDEMRRDIREDRDGTALDLAIRVRDAECEPLAGVMVEVWHCDAQGFYSGFEDASNDARGLRAAAQTDGASYLRGTQTTDGDGIVRFLTICPGWYPGRSVHVHAKVHLVGSEVLTTQLYFNDDVTATIHQAQPAYSSEGSPDTTNAQDAFFAAENLLTVSEEADGYLGLINVGIRD